MLCSVYWPKLFFPRAMPCRFYTSFSGGGAEGQPGVGAIGSRQAFRARRMLRSFLHDRVFVQDSVAFFMPDVGPSPSPSLKGRGVHVALLIRYPSMIACC